MSKKINQGLSTSHTPFHQGKSLISVVTLVAFITTTIWNPGVSFAMTPLPASEVNLPYQASIDSTFKFFIPKDLGKVESMDFGQGPGIVHIQTAHGHYEAQQKIRKILHHLDKNYGIRTLLVEGSAFKLRPEILNFFPEDPKRTMKVADRLAQQALVKGPELYLLDRIGAAEAGDRVLRPAEAYGIEDARIYRENGEAFVRVLTQKQKTEQFLRDMDEGITLLSAPHLSDSLRRFIRTQESFEKRLMSVDAWFSYLRDETRKNLLLDLGHPANQIEWPMMVRLFKIRELQKNLDLQQFGKEREKFLKAVERFIPEEGQAAGNDDLVSAARQVSVRPISFLAQIGELLQIDRMGQQLPDPETSLLFEAMVRRLPSNFNYRLYPNVCYFIGILLLTSEVKADRLMDESSRVAEMITSRLARTDSEKAIVALLKDYRLLQKLFALELLPEDYETILASSAIGGSSLSNGQNVLSPSSIVRRLESLASQTPGAGRSGKVQFSHLDELDGLFDSAMQFYAGVKARDLAMIGMVEKRLKETGVGKVAVVTGGFHARPFRDYFSSQGYTYALVTPKITDQDEAGHRHYIENTLRMTRVGAEPASNNQATNQASSHLAFHARTSTRETVPLMHTRQELGAMGVRAGLVAIARMAGVPLTAINRAEARLTKQVADEVSRQVGSSQRALENIKQAPTFDELNLDVQNAFWEVFQNTRLIPDEAYLDDWYVRNRNALLDVLSSRPEARTEPVDESNETIGERMDRLKREETLLMREDSRLEIGISELSSGERASRKKRQSEIESALDKIRGSIRELYDLPREDQVIRRRIGKLNDKEFHLSIKSNRLGTNTLGLSREELADRKKRQSEIESALDKIRESIRALHLRRRALREVLFSQANDPLPEIHNWKEINLEEHEYLADETLVLFLQDLPGEEFQNWVKSLGRLLESGKSLSETERKIGLYVFEELYLENGDSRSDLVRIARASRRPGRLPSREERERVQRENERLQREKDLNNFLIDVAVRLVASAILGAIAYFCFLFSSAKEGTEAGKTPVESSPAPAVEVDQSRPRSELRAEKKATTQELAEAVIRDAAASLSMDPVLLEKIIKHERVIHVTIPVRMDDGSVRNFHGFRVQHNSARGPYKGGIRMSDQHDEEGTLEEAKGLSTWMSVKTAVVGIPLGGGKGDILASRASLSEAEQARLIRGYARTIMEQEGIDVFGPFSDIPAPDMNTDGKMMAWFADEYIKIMAEHEKIFDQRILAPLREFIGNMKETDPVKVEVLREYIRLTQDETIAGYRLDTIEPATVTGKPAGKSPEGDSMIFPVDPANPYLGGSQGREKATGQGGFFALERVLHHQRKSSVKGVSYALQGFGNVAGFFARIANRSGMLAKAIQSAYPAGKDETGKTRFVQFTIYNEKGIDIAALDQWILSESNRLGKKPGEFSLENFPGARVIANEDFWKLNVDVMVPAATNNVITEKNAGLINAPVILELANGPTSVEGDKILLSRGKLVIPDVLANAGGVIVSYFEMIQNYTHDRWTTAMVDRMLSERMSQATDDAMRIMNSYGKTFRQAVYMSALMKIADAQIARDPELKARYEDGTIQPYDSHGLSRRPETTNHLNFLTQKDRLAALLAETAREFNAEIVARVDRISGRFSKGVARNPVVLITGPESAGKEVVAESIVKELQRREDFKQSGRKVHFVDYDLVNPEEFEQLLSGQRTQLLQPQYTFYGMPVWTPITVNVGDVIVVEGRAAFSVANLKPKDQGANLYFGKEDVYKIFVNVPPSFNLTVSKRDQAFVPKGMPLTSLHLRFIREILDRQNRRGETMTGAGIVGLLEGWHGLKEMQNRTVYPQWSATDETINMYFPEEIAVIRNQALRLLVLALRHARQELPGSLMLARQMESAIAFLREVNPVNPEELPEGHPVRQWAVNHQATTRDGFERNRGGGRDGSARLSRAEARVSLDTPTLIGMVIKIVTDYRSDQPFPLEARSLLWSAKAAIGNGDFEGAIKSLDKANVALAGLASDYTRRRIIQLRDVLSKRIARSENRSENGEDETIEEGSRWGKVFEATFYAGSLVIAANVPLLLFVYAVGRWANQMEGFTAVPFFLTIGGTTVILMGIGAGIFNGLLFVGKRFFGFSPLKTVLQDKGVSRRAPSEPKPESDDSVSRKRSEARSTSVLMEEMLFPTQLIEERWDLKQVINPFMLTLIREFYYGIIPERVREGIETGLNTAGQALRAMMEAVGVSPADATGLSTADRKEIFQRALEILGIRKPSVDVADVFVLGAELLKKLRENDGRGLVAFREALQGSLVAVVTDSETLASINQILGEAGLEPYLSTQKLKNHLPKGAVVRAVLLAGETLSEEDNRLLRIAERNIIRMTQGMLDRFMLVMEQIVTAIMGEKAISRSA